MSFRDSLFRAGGTRERARVKPRESARDWVDDSMHRTCTSERVHAGRLEGAKAAAVLTHARRTTEQRMMTKYNSRE